MARSPYKPPPGLSPQTNPKLTGSVGPKPMKALAPKPLGPPGAGRGGGSLGLGGQIGKFIGGGSGIKTGGRPGNAQPTPLQPATLGPSPTPMQSKIAGRQALTNRQQQLVDIFAHAYKQGYGGGRRAKKILTRGIQKKGLAPKEWATLKAGRGVLAEKVGKRGARKYARAYRRAQG
jgi:hypothetical protein